VGVRHRDHGRGFDDRFKPLRPASRPRLIVAFLLGPVGWVVALIFAAYLIERTDAIETGLLVTAGSFVFALVVLTLLRFGRRREERRYAERA
jgi:zinc transporter ZupT